MEKKLCSECSSRTVPEKGNLSTAGTGKKLMESSMILCLIIGFLVTSTAFSQNNMDPLVTRPDSVQSDEKIVLRCAEMHNVNSTSYTINNDELRTAFLECLGGTRYRVGSGRLDSKHCLLRVFSSEDYDQCKFFNWSIDKIKDSVKREDAIYQRLVARSRNRTYFRGSKCSVDCSGHKAGYAWADDNYISSYSECNSESDSFRKGCEIYVDENDYVDSADVQ